MRFDQISEGEYGIVWSLPVNNGDTELVSFAIEGGTIEENVLYISEGIAGKTLSFKGLNEFNTTVVLEINYLDEESFSLLIDKYQNQLQVPFAPNQLDTFKSYMILGIEHILFGFDHLLFVLALLVMCKGFKNLIKTITAFTLAHSITLGLASLGIMNLPSTPVEIVIAASIVVLAREIIAQQQGKNSFLGLYPWSAAFIFGLIHGFGFAGVLEEIGLPTKHIAMALFSFNVGVEVGQVAFVIIMLALLKGFQQISSRTTEQLPKYLAYGIGSIASFWFIERLFWI